MEIITKNTLSRFSPSDWSASNIDHYNSADSSRNQSERIRNEAIRLIREREDKTTLTQRDCGVKEGSPHEAYWARIGKNVQSLY